MAEKVFVIAECGSSWRFGDDHIANAYRMIEAAKECGADAVKFQWCSDSAALAVRRGEPQYAEAYKFVEYDPSWLASLKHKADEVGIEWMCTAFLPQDVGVIAPMVKRFKVAAKESVNGELVEAISDAFNHDDHEQIIMSQNHNTLIAMPKQLDKVAILICISKYPCPLEEAHLRSVTYAFQPNSRIKGYSDHTGHVLTGAVAVGAGARVIESNIRLQDTHSDNPDYPHSLEADYPFSEGGAGNWNRESYEAYVENIRIAERML